MAAIALSLTLDQVTPSLAALTDARLKERILQAVGTVIMSNAQRAFDEPALRAKPWPLRKKSYSHPLLIKSGTLRQSIHVQRQGSDSVKIGTPVKYGAIHQLGSSKASGRGSGVPARPFFPVLNDALTGNARMEIQDAVDALVGSAGNG